MQPRALQRSECKPVWVQHEQHRIQKQERSVRAESKHSLSSQCSCAGRGTQYHSSRPCFALCDLFFLQKGFTPETLQIFCPCPQGSRSTSGSCGSGGFVSLWCWQDIKSELHQPRSPQLQYLRYPSQWVPEAWRQHKEVSGHCPRQIIIKFKYQSMRSLLLLEAWVLNYFLLFFF